MTGRKLLYKLLYMNWMKHMSALIVCLGISLLSFAQQEIVSTNYRAPGAKGFYLGGQISTNGIGGNIRYALNDKFSVRTGYENVSLTFGFHFDENDITYNADFEYKTGGLLFLFDYAYTKNLYISAGAIVNSFNPKLSGVAVSDFEYGDIVVPAEDIGDFIFSAKPQLAVSPYGSAGFRAFIGQRDGIVFNFETGLYYMGPPDIEIETTGLLAPTSDPAFGHEEYLEYQFDAYKIFPVIKLGIAVKLF